ncbi:MAG TPA: ABC transporter substrate-binding protein, partial [Tabrizicola sp.]
MKKLITAAFLAAMATGASAEDVKLQLKWVTQAQFAGYYVAQAKGFYEEEGLNVTIMPGGPDIAPVTLLQNGEVDVMV